jgi:hypothetical protein
VALAAALTLLGSLWPGLDRVQARPLAPTEIQQFAISIGDTVSDGVPAAGAGNIEEPGAVDIYTFNANAGQEIIFNWLSGSNVLIGWQLQAPDSTVLFDSVLFDWQLTLPQTGTYTLTVDGNNSSNIGLYSFQLLEVPAAPQQFTIGIGDMVSNGVPATGAGNIEVPGAVDVYTFDALAGQEVIFDWLSGTNVFIGWQLQAPDSTMLFDSVLQDWQVVLPQTGSYTLTVDGNGIDDFGLYSFQLLAVPTAPDQFTIGFGNTVSNGVPAAGAGNIEVPGAVDIYTFDALAGQQAIFDWLSGFNVFIGWQLQAPDSTVLFDSVLQDWQVVLPQTGTYTLTVDGNGIDDFGLYSFQLLEVPSAPQQFTINFGDTVSDGVPATGAGNIEVPGAVDIYTVDATAGQKVIFDWLSGSNVLIGWQLEAPDSTVLFDSVLQDQQVMLLQTGNYTLTVDGNAIDNVGLYSFQLLEVPAVPDQFAIDFGDTISDGVPATGAGNIEVPGAVDIYTFDALAGQEAFFNWLTGSSILISWQLQAPDSTVLFDSVLQDQQLVLPQTGSYTLTAQGAGIDDFGIYSFAFLEGTNEEWHIFLPIVVR